MRAIELSLCLIKSLVSRKKIGYNSEVWTCHELLSHFEKHVQDLLGPEGVRFASLNFPRRLAGPSLELHIYFTCFDIRFH